MKSMSKKSILVNCGKIKHILNVVQDPTLEIETRGNILNLYTREVTCRWDDWDEIEQYGDLELVATLSKKQFRRIFSANSWGYTEKLKENVLSFLERANSALRKSIWMEIEIEE